MDRIIQYISNSWTRHTSTYHPSPSQNSYCKFPFCKKVQESCQYIYHSGKSQPILLREYLFSWLPPFKKQFPFWKISFPFKIPLLFCLPSFFEKFSNLVERVRCLHTHFQILLVKFRTRPNHWKKVQQKTRYLLFVLR